MVFKVQSTLEDCSDSMDYIDLILLDEIHDCNKWQVGEMGEDGEVVEDELIFGMIA